MRRGGEQRRDIAGQQEGLAVFQKHISVRELHFASPDRFHFPPGQYQTRFEPLVELVIEFSAFVQGDGAR